jgi:outer membrane receptor protein involved in Fe transport
LKPEKIDTYELSFGANLTEALNVRITGFHNTVKDSIELATTAQGTRMFQNESKIRSQGIETEMKYDFGKGTYAGANYTYQDVKNLDTDERAWNAPMHKGNLFANIRLSRNFNLFTDMYWQGKYTRASGDSRSDNDGFVLVNTTLLVKNFWKELELRGSIYNVFDTDYTFPTANGSLPVDYPMPGRSLS